MDEKALISLLRAVNLVKANYQDGVVKAEIKEINCLVYKCGTVLRIDFKGAFPK